MNILTQKLRKIRSPYILDIYWIFAKERQDIFIKRINGQLAPWTKNSILSTYKFTNVYRASDRVSQYLIKNVIYKGNQNFEEVFFRIILFKFFNKIETWEHISNKINGTPQWKSFNIEVLDKILTDRLNECSIYSPAYMMPTPAFNKPKKHQNHLFLLSQMMKNKLPKKIINSKSLKEVYSLMRKQQSLGDFLAFQYTIDLNYSEIINFDENDFVVAGSGAIRGIQKCFPKADKTDYEKIIYYMTEIAENEFKRLGLTFKNLFGRPLKPIDCQNIFCEVDKYLRVAHPDIQSNRKKIKQKFSYNSKPLPQWYPPKWKLNVLENMHELNAPDHIFEAA